MSERGSPRSSSGGVRVILGAGGGLFAVSVAVLAWGFFYVPPGPAVLLVTLDMVRADHLGPYGYDQGTSPHLDALARRAIIFDDAYTNAVLSAPAHASVLTGRTPAEHGLVNNLHVLPDEEITVAELAAGSGLKTAAFVSEELVGPEVGLHQGFQTFRVLKNKNHLHETQSDAYAKRTVRAAAAWLREHGRDGRFFAWVHLQNAHFDWFPPEAARERFVPEHLRAIDVSGFECVRDQNRWFEDPRHRTEPLPEGYAAVMTARYDAEIFTVDEGVGELVDALEKSGARQRTVIIVLSDHGATLFDRRVIDHTDVFFEETLRSALLIHLPFAENPQLVPGFVELTQVASTIAEALDLRLPAARSTGESLFTVAQRGRGASPFPRRAWLYGKEDGAVREGDLKLIVRGGIATLFDLARDPEETTDLAATRPEAVKALTAHLAAARERLKPSERTLDPQSSEVTRMLREGGYLDEEHR